MLLVGVVAPRVQLPPALQPHSDAVSNVHDPRLTQVVIDGLTINPGSQQNAGVKTPVVLQLSLVQIEHMLGPDTV